VRSSEISPFDLGFAIGLIVAQGAFTADRKQPTLSVKLNARDPEPLARLEELLGGRRYGPYSHGDREYYLWLLRGDDLRATIPILERHLPPCAKRRQFDHWLEQHQAYFSARQLYTTRRPRIGQAPTSERAPRNG
jgi:hypothetical protein